ncbi:MAG: hypothetical protein H6705_04610 [Myxococcales bacterium]|nr:hypothetical protein [Myxococcales bacterium]
MSDVYLDSSIVGYRHRARRLMIAAIGVFVVLIGRLAWLQVVEGDDLQAASTRNYVRTVMLPADRGTIYDRNGKVLAVNRPSFDLYVTPAQVEDIDALIDGLRQVIDLDELDAVRLREQVEEPRGMWRYRAVRVARDIDRQRVALAEALRARVDGISIRVHYQREYPEGPIGAHLVGYLGKPRPERSPPRATATRPTPCSAASASSAASKTCSPATTATNATPSTPAAPARRAAGPSRRCTTWSPAARLAAATTSASPSTSRSSASSSTRSPSTNPAPPS